MSAAPATIIYDGSCSMCSRCVALLLRYDRAGRLRALAGGVESSTRFGTAAEDAMYVFAEGRQYRGYRAFEAIFDRLPGTGKFARIMRWNPVAAAGEPVYAWIARHRGSLRWIVPVLAGLLRLTARGEDATA